MRVQPGCGTFFFEGGPIGTVLVHSMCTSPAAMRPMGDFLARRGITVIAPRMAGHGTSVDELERTRMEDWVASVESGVDVLRDRCDSVYVIGSSMGGPLSLHVGARRPDAVTGVGSINGPITVREDFVAMANDMDAPLRIRLPWAMNPRHATHDPQSSTFRYPEVPRNVIRETFRLFRDVDAELPTITTPARLFYSNDDVLVDSSNGRHVYDRLGSSDKALIELTDSAHSAPLDYDMERICLEWLSFMKWSAADVVDRTNGLPGRPASHFPW